MSKTTTLLRSRNVNGNKTSQHSSSKTSLPLHNDSTTEPSLTTTRIFLSKKKSEQSGTPTGALVIAVFVSIVVALLLLVGGKEQSISITTKTTFRTLKNNVNNEEGTLIYDVAIAGAGPAGLTAALFGARAGLNVIVLGSETGLLSETLQLDNFPSFFNGSGPAWLKATKQQAIQFGATFATPGLLVKKITLPNHHQNEEMSFTLQTATTQTIIRAWSVIVATGATPRRLGLPHEDVLWGKTLHNCAICDGHLYRDKTVLVVGGGDAAVDAAILLSRYAKQVYLVHRRIQMSGKNQLAIQLAETTPNIEIHKPFVVKQWQLDDNRDLIGATICDSQNKSKEYSLSIDGAFIMIGATPNTEWIKGLVDMDNEGFVRLNGTTETFVPGIFAVGEASDKVYKQAITASAAGAQAAIDAERWLRETRGVQKQEHKKKKKHVNIPLEPKVETNNKAISKTDHDCDLTQQECINQIIHDYPIVVFSKTYCLYCRKALEALQAAGVSEPHVVDLTHDKRARQIQATLQTMTGRRTVPNVFVGGKSIGGGDETAALQAQGKLVSILVEAGALPNQDNDGRESCDLKQESCIRDIIQKYPVVMFTLEWCPECKQTLEFLKSVVGAKTPHLVDLDDYKPISQDIRKHMMTISGRRSVPNLFIGGEHFGGFSQMTKMHNEGKLMAKLRQVDWPVNQV